MTAHTDAETERVQRIFAERAAALARPQADHDRPETIELLVLSVGATHAAVPADRAREVLAPGPVARVPSGQSSLTGVRSVRGEMLAVADLATLLATGSSTPARECWTVVLEHPVAPVGLLVDGAVGLVDVPAAALRAARQDGTHDDLVASTTPDGAVVLDVDAVLRDVRLFVVPPPQQQETP